MFSGAFENVCIFHILDGLSNGLSHYSEASRVALVYAINPGDPLNIYDPQNLLRGHEPKLKEYYLDSNEWRMEPASGQDVVFLDREEYEGLQLAGIITFGGRSGTVAYQMWFTEEHLDMCSHGPTIRWMEYAVRLFSQNYRVQNVLGIDITGYALQQCAVHAVRDHIVDERSMLIGLDTQLRIYPILDAIQGISRTREEGAWARGALAFVDPAQIRDMRLMASFPELERPRLDNFKHVRKLLQAAEGHGRMLVSDGQHICGIGVGELPSSSLLVEFYGGHGFLRLGGELVCSFSDGSFHSTNRKANLVQVEEALVESDMDLQDQLTLFQIITKLVHAAAEHKHGCSLIIDTRKMPVRTSGQYLVEPLDLQEDSYLDLACALSKVDGALHIDRNIQLMGFACLMDGHSVPGENRGRGARFNSALRYTAENEDIIVVVVSSDRPVSVFQSGVELTDLCEWRPVSGCPVPPSLDAWIKDPWL